MRPGRGLERDKLCSERPVLLDFRELGIEATCDLAGQTMGLQAVHRRAPGAVTTRIGVEA
jgi:hypothetical protein